MCRITKQLRPLTEVERSTLQQHVRGSHSKCLSPTVPDDVVGLEYTIHVQEIWRPQSAAAASLPPAQQLYLLFVTTDILLAFEQCFMEHCAVYGTFPATVVRVTCAVTAHGAIAAPEDVSPLRMPLSFRWEGPTAPVRSVAYPATCGSRILPIYRLWALEEAIRRVAP